MEFLSYTGTVKGHSLFVAYGPQLPRPLPDQGWSDSPGEFRGRRSFPWRKGKHVEVGILEIAKSGKRVLSNAFSSSPGKPTMTSTPIAAKRQCLVNRLDQGPKIP